MYIKEDTQSQFADLPFSQDIFNANHPLLRLSQAIQWDNLMDYLKQFYSETQGRPSTPIRAQAATLMLKYIKNLSDRTGVNYVQENIYAQRFCALTPAQANDYMDPASGLSGFRAKIGPEGMAFIREILTAAARGKSLKKGNKLIIDTTCVPLDILYPTDIRLLERCRHAVMRCFKKAKSLGLKILYRTYNRTARKVFVNFSKLSKPSEKTRKRVHKQMFQFVLRNFKQLADMRTKASQQLGRQCKIDPTLWAFLKTLKETEIKVQTILHQQKIIRQGNLHIPNRIVSFHK